MTNNTIEAWELSQENGTIELSLPDMSSLDAVTRQLPQGFYTTFRTYGGGQRVLGLRAHLRRLYGPAVERGIEVSFPVGELRRELADILGAYPDEARARLMMAANGQVYLAVEPLKPLPVEIYLHGVKAVTINIQRQNPRLKSTAFISASERARSQIAENKVFEALLVQEGFILEGMTSNFFYFMGGKLGTARQDVLLGVTRRTVLRVARGRGMEIIYQPLKLEHIPALEEAFLTSSSRGIVPIVRIDDVMVGEGNPGVLTKRLSVAYDNYVNRHAEKISFGSILA